jgi:hypothetical protein
MVAVAKREGGVMDAGCLFERLIGEETNTRAPSKLIFRIHVVCQPTGKWKLGFRAVNEMFAYAVAVASSALVDRNVGRMSGKLSARVN